MDLTPAWHTTRRRDWLSFAKSLGPFFLVITCVLWICLPIFWGSTLLLEHYFYRLNIFVVDFDSQAVGPANALAGPSIVQTLTELNSSPGPHLTYQVVPPQQFPGGAEEVMEYVGHSRAWGAVVIMPNATTAWRNAIQTGNASYDASGCVGVYYSGAHYYQIVLLYVVPFLKENVMPALRKASDTATRSFLQTAVSARNATAIATAARAPQALGIGFGMFTYDVRPVTAWASAAPFEAADIYSTIYTFLFTVISAIARLSTGLQMKLSTASLIKLRLAVPAFCYFWFSLWYVLVVRAFQVPLEASVGRAGFVVFWMLNYITYLALGLALEALLSLFTIRWFPFALISWIILNITASFLPLQLMQPFYFWGYAWPFRLNVEASKIIFYDTQERHHLGRYFGGLMAWAFAGVVSLALFQLLDRWRMDRTVRQGMARKKEQESNSIEDGQGHSHGYDHDHPHGHEGEKSAQHRNATAVSPASSRQDTQHRNSPPSRDTSGSSDGVESSEPGQGPQQQQFQQKKPAFLAAGGARTDSQMSGQSTYYDAPPAPVAL